MSTSFIGVDAGGTNTRAILASADGTVLGRGRAGGANSWSSDSSVAEVVTAAAGEALAGSDAATVAGGVVAIAGGGSTSPAIAAELEACWRGLGLAAAPTIVIDVLAAYAAGTVEPEGVVLSAGTGAIAAAVADRRVVRRADGRGWLVGDAGSAVWLGIQGTRAALEALDGRSPATSLSTRIPEALGVRATAPEDIAEDIVTATYSRPPAELGRLAPTVVEAAGQDDTVAAALVEQAADELARTLATVAGEAVPQVVVLAGSLLTHAEPIDRGVRRRLEARWPGVPIRGTSSAEAGAVALAMALHGDGPVSGEVLDRLRG